MKVQSDLAGDRKRREETSRPRENGATKWINGTSDAMRQAADSILRATAAIPDVRFSPALTKALGAIAIKSDNEVNYRPAVERSTVCTP